MKKLITLLFVFVATAAHAQTQSADAASAWSNFLEKLRMKIEHITPQKKLNSVTAVGGVRGAEVETADVYWKGETKPQAIDADELAAFKKGMSFIDDNQIEQARTAFTDFIKSYPDSTLKADATDVLKNLPTQTQ